MPWTMIRRPCRCRRDHGRRRARRAGQHRAGQPVDVWCVLLVAGLMATAVRQAVRLFLLLGLRLEVLLDLDVPLLVGGGGVDLDLEAVGHVRR